jgi:hypothetical protein
LIHIEIEVPQKSISEQRDKLEKFPRSLVSDEKSSFSKIKDFFTKLLIGFWKLPGNLCPIIPVSILDRMGVGLFPCGEFPLNVFKFPIQRIEELL